MADTLEIRKGRKFDQVLDGAREVFLRDGFEGAKVDDIARAAQVSKATLYSYFPDKRMLFTQMVTRELRQLQQDAMELADFSQPPDTLLPLVARFFIRFFSSDIGLKIFRTCVAESERFPDIGKEFYQTGPVVMQGKMREYLHMAQDRGEIQCDDFELAAAQFSELCKSELWLKLIFGIMANPSDADIARIADGATQTFLARYGAG